jgi:hypothetical protein
MAHTLIESLAEMKPRGAAQARQGGRSEERDSS